MDPQNEVLSASRITKIVSTLQDRRGTPQALKFTNRTPMIPAAEGEIMARFQGHVLIADLIADGQRAATYSAGKIYTETTSAPNLKIGQSLDQEQLNMLLAKVNNMEVLDDLYPSTETRIVDNLRKGVWNRVESINIAARIGGFSYDRLGIKMENVDFGMPADLRLTPADEWTDKVNAKPVTDLMLVKRIGSIKYGIEYDRVTMTLAAFNAMIETDEFQLKAKPFLRNDLTFTNLASANTEEMKNLAAKVVGLEIEIYDARYWYENLADKAVKSAPFLPINKVILESKSSDNDASVIDFGNGVVTEALISKLAKTTMMGELPANARGPVGYATAEHNPPSATYWSVARGFARRHVLQASACLTIAPDTGTGSLIETVDFEDYIFV